MSDINNNNIISSSRSTKGSDLAKEKTSLATSNSSTSCQKESDSDPVGKRLHDSGESKPVPIFSSSGEQLRLNEDNRTNGGWGGERITTSQLCEQTVFRILNNTWKKHVRERPDNHQTRESDLSVKDGS